MELKPFQNEASDELKSKIIKLLEGDKKIIGFQAPTGSGKTIMMAEAIKRVINEKASNIEICFVWLAVNKLQLQSKDKLDKYYENYSKLTCIEWDDIKNENEIPENRILFFNWSSINRGMLNKINQDGESQVSLENKIIETGNIDRKIILIIDESHHTANSSKSKEMIKTINPNVIVKMSATLDLNAPDITPIKVSHDVAVKQEMIKKSIFVNYVEDYEAHGSWTDKDVVKIAIDKREELLQMYRNEKKNINPLILIQIPNENDSGSGINCKYVENILSEFGITRKDKLGIYLDNEEGGGKIHLENIDDEDNEVEVLIFKQAIAVGWDCPRASILVTFRDMQSEVFTIQLLGRIMRMPEFEHYQNHDELNHAYVFTNIESMNFKLDDFKLDYINEKISKMKDDLDDVCLLSEHVERNNERTRLDAKFGPLFDKEAKRNDLIKKMNLDDIPLTKDIIYGEIKNTDIQFQMTETFEINITDEELIDKFFNKFIDKLTGNLATQRSAEVIINTLINFFKSELKIDDMSKMTKLTVLNQNNREAIHRCVDLAIHEYELISKERDAVIRENKSWNIPKLMGYPGHYTVKNFDKSIMNPVHVPEGGNYGTELKFMEKLNEDENVVWWFKNGENSTKYFSIVYKDNISNDDEYLNKHTFYVDFIIKSKKGKIWLLDTKSGTTLTDEKTKFKSNYLIEYINTDSNQTGLDGGIVRYDEKTNGWLYFTGEKYTPDTNNHDWKILNFG